MGSKSFLKSIYSLYSESEKKSVQLNSAEYSASSNGYTSVCWLEHYFIM